MDSWLIVLIVATVVTLLVLGRILDENITQPYHAKEGFTGEAGAKEVSFDDVKGAVPESSGTVQWLDNEALYDSFYASVYDQLTQGSVRTQAEVGLMLHEWTKQGEDLKTFEVLDVGCGTGIATAALAKIGCKKVVGMDASEAMIQQAKTVTIPQSTLTEEQKGKIQWLMKDAMHPSAAKAGEFSHTFLMYFTVYYIGDKEALFRNLFFWTKPGGKLVIGVVNKHKFDPLLDSASPFSFSLQKYSKQRLTKSEVAFTNFKYTGEFDLQDPGAEYRETFRFPNKTIRRQRHTFRMEDINTIVGYAKAAGWTYTGFVDLVTVGFEYGYHLHFRKS